VFKQTLIDYLALISTGGEIGATKGTTKYPIMTTVEMLREKIILDPETYGLQNASPEAIRAIAQEMATITVLADIIMPKDAVSGSASDAKVPEFIEFIVKDMPEHQTPLRGGLRWLDMQCFRQFNQSFTDITDQQRLTMVDQIAYPEKAAPDMKFGVSFFNKMRDLVTTGFYTSEMGVKDLGYMGNVPNQWNGVPDDVLKQYGYAYSERELKECVSYDNAAS
jgi:hypothetical protein